MIPRKNAAPARQRDAALREAKALVEAGWTNTRDWTPNRERARALLEDALRGAPDDTALLTGLGAVLSDLGHHRQAAEVLARAVALGSTDAHTYHNLAVALVNLRRGYRRMFARAAKLPASQQTWAAYFDPHGH